MFQKVVQGTVAGSLLVIAGLAVYYAIDYFQAKRAIQNEILLHREREVLEEYRRAREADRNR
jgi:hypothetical protein